MDTRNAKKRLRRDGGLIIVPRRIGLEARKIVKELEASGEKQIYLKIAYETSIGLGTVRDFFGIRALATQANIDKIHNWCIKNQTK